MKNQTAKCISYGPEWQPDGTRERYRSIENASRGLRIVGASHDIIRTRDDICYARGIVRQWVRDLRTAGHALPPSTRETVRLRIRALRESVHAMHKRIGELTSNPYAMMEG